MELIRKVIHLSGLMYIPAYDLFGRKFVAFAVGFLTALAIVLDVLRRRYNIIPEFLLRDYEKKGIGAFVYFGVAALLMTLTLPKDACYVGIGVGCLGDSVAGIVKHRFRKPEYAPICMFISSILFLHVLGLPTLPSFFGVVAGVLLEGSSFLNDNFTIPIASSTIFFLSEIVL